MKTLIRTGVERIIAWAARQEIANQHPLIVGVTGSAGKTTTKEAIGHVLRKTITDRKIIVSPGNLNTEFGLPLAILQLAKPEGATEWAMATFQAIGKGFMATIRSRSVRPPVYVLEYGVEQPGDMKQLVGLARPMIAVVTNIGSAHTQFLGSLESVAKEKVELVRALPENGLAILNDKDPLVKKMAERTVGRVVFVDGSGIDGVMTLAAAVAEHGFQIDPKTAQSALKSWQRPRGRLQLIKGIKGSWLLDDTYNANTLSMRLALSQLQQLAKTKKSKRRIAVLGDMLELGKEEYEVHCQIAQEATKFSDILILVGPRFRRTKLGNAWFPGPLPAAAYLLSIVTKDDMILVKGSQSMRMEKVSEVLLDDPKSANQVLERQSAFWKKKPYVTP
jgi:UDP-N-acetylmuramyl pentapeptide synthase